MSTQHVNKGRTLATTVDNLLESPRLKFAIEFFSDDPARLRAILIELANESARVQKQTCVSAYSRSFGLDAVQMKAYLKNQSIGSTFNIYWGLSEAEKMLYAIDPKSEKLKHERLILLDQIHKELMEDETPDIEISE